MDRHAAPPSGGPAPSATDPSLRSTFETRGFVGPVPILTPREASDLRRELAREPEPETRKGYGASSPGYYRIASHPAIVDRVAALIGDDVMVWGASLVTRRPGQVHPWHTDMETAGDEGRTVSVWLGLENVNARSSLQVIPGSHAYGVTIQELTKANGLHRDDVHHDVALRWARDRDPDVELFVADMGNGDAVFFDGRLWHGTNNTNEDGRRVALLLQYATPDRPMRTPDYSHLEVPFKFFDEPRPPCVMVRGTDRYAANRIVPPPTEATGTASWVRTLDLPLAEDPDTGWRIHKIHSGPTPCMTRLGCHASVLSPGASPHPPHRHQEEEILVVLDGEAVLTIGAEGDGGAREVAAGPGDFAYYPAWHVHTLRNASERPVTYLMFKWRGEGSGTAPGASRGAGTAGRALDAAFHPAAGAHEEAGSDAEWTTRTVLDGPTEYLRKLHMHWSALAPEAGYPPHVDAYDVALVVLEGQVETLGARLGRGGVAFYAAGEPHGIRNVGDEGARYMAFEFHGEHRSEEAPRARGSALRRIAAVLPAPVKRLARRAVRRLRRRS